MKTIVIGYGNTLRSDDGAGYRVAEQVKRWQHPSLAAWPAQQLLPEMAAALAEVELAIFVDAKAQTTTAILECCHLKPQTQQLWMHHLEPTSLLALTEQLYGCQPRAYWLLLPAENFAFGEQLSPRTQASLDLAVAKILELTNCTVEVVDARS